jgi:transposase
MSYRIAGIDVHKKLLAVVVSDVEVAGEYQFERRMFGSNPEQLRSLAAWLIEREVEEVVMESTAQYWKPVWGALERYWKPLRQKREGAGRMSGTLHLAQAQSNRGRRGRKRDFPDAERLVKRLMARELTLSFVPDAEQRLWRTVTRRKYQLTRDHVRLQNQLESLLEEAHIKLSSLVSDLLGASARRMLKALADGETNPAALAALADQHLRATPEQLCDALSACTDLKTRVPKAPEDGAGAVAIPRAADRPTGPGDGQSAQSAPGCSQAAGGGAGSGSGFRPTDHCRSRSHRCDISF